MGRLYYNTAGQSSFFFYFQVFAKIKALIKSLLELFHEPAEKSWYPQRVTTSSEPQLLSAKIKSKGGSFVGNLMFQFLFTLSNAKFEWLVTLTVSNKFAVQT